MGRFTDALNEQIGREFAASRQYVARVRLGLGEAGSVGFVVGATGRERIVLAMVVWSQVWAVGYLAGPAVAGVLAERLGFAAVGLLPLAALLLVAPLLGAVRTAASSPTPS